MRRAVISMAILVSLLGSPALAFEPSLPAGTPMPINKVWQRTPAAKPDAKARPDGKATARPRPVPAANKLDLNSCTLEQLQNLPGVGPAMGGHIMAGRPYRTFDDLARNGVPLNTIERIKPLVVLGP
jgi:competence protein ComEA